MPQAEPVPSNAPDAEPVTVATPEGDNEFAPDQPLTGTDPAVEGLETPRGNAPQPYKNDHENPAPSDAEQHHAPTGLEKFIDEISNGTLMP